jgi:Flp pilus assembly pilin Flp
LFTVAFSPFFSYGEIMKLISKFLRKKRGATAIEYAIIASMLSVFIIVGLEATGGAVKDSYETSGAKLEAAFEAASGDDSK